MKANHNKGEALSDGAKAVVNILKEQFESKSQRSTFTTFYSCAVVNILKEQFESKSQQIPIKDNIRCRCGKYLKRTI